jgi:hypothetical protein
MACKKTSGEGAARAPAALALAAAWPARALGAAAARLGVPRGVLALFAALLLAEARLVLEYAPVPLWACGPSAPACMDRYGPAALDKMELTYATYRYEATSGESPAAQAAGRAGEARTAAEMAAVAARMDPAYVPYAARDIIDGAGR